MLSKYFICILVQFLFTTTLAFSQQHNNNNLDADVIINFSGARLSKVLEKFGFPDDITGYGTQNNYDALLDYTTFGFKISNKTVIICYFWKDWNKTIRGIKIGDKKTLLIEKWGEPAKSLTMSDGTPFFAWELKELDSYLIAFLNNDDTIKRISVELK